MRLVVRKLEVLGLEQLQSLVIENLDGIESGLTVLDSRLFLGHATVDIVALDAEGALILVTVGFTADEEMLLKAVEAYSWCLEYPDAIRRLYPSVDISAARPPRLMFVVERLPDAFHRKIKQLGFSEIDCVEFRHLDVSGTAAAYFDTIARLRRGSGIAEFQPAPIARRVSEPQMRRAPEPIIADRPIPHADNVVPLPAGPTGPRSTSMRLQKILGTGGPGHTTGAAPVIDLVGRTAAPVTRNDRSRGDAGAAKAETTVAAVEAAMVDTVMPQTEPPRLEIGAPPLDSTPLAEIGGPSAETPDPQPEAPHMEGAAIEAFGSPFESPAPRIEPPVRVVERVAAVSLREAVPAAPPVAIPATDAPPADRRVSFAEIASELLGKLTGVPTTQRPAVDETLRLVVGDTAATASEAAAQVESAVAVVDVPVAAAIEAAAASAVEPENRALGGATPVVEVPAVPVTPKRVFTAPKPVTLAPKPLASAPTIAPAPKLIVTAPKPIAPPPTPVTPAPTPLVGAPATAVAPSAPAAPREAAPTAGQAPAASQTPAQNLPQEFEGLKFPNDGVLTRQWMEFLNQMASSK